MKLYFSVGEPSGDLHGANFIRAVKTHVPEAEFIGLGGPLMEEAGCRLQFDLTSLAVMMFSRVLAKMPQFFRLLREAEQAMRTARPDAVVLIDFPGFNWHIAKIAKKLGIPVFYYGTPQLWAWASWRVAKMRKYVDHVLCKLPFEEAWYRERGCRAEFVGHPFFDETSRRRLDGDFLAAQKALPGRLIAILPGSRSQEVAANLPVFLKTAEKLSRRVPDARFAIASFNEKQAATAKELCERTGYEVPIHVGRTPELMSAAHSCLACSGSVSLELLWHEKPSVIHYGVSLPLYLFARYCMMKVKYVTLVNILADERSFFDMKPYDRDSIDAEIAPFPEYATWRDVSDHMADDLAMRLENPAIYERIVTRLRELKESFAQPGASERAARYVVQTLQGKAAAIRAA